MLCFAPLSPPPPPLNPSFLSLSFLLSPPTSLLCARFCQSLHSPPQSFFDSILVPSASQIFLLRASLCFVPSFCFCSYPHCSTPSTRLVYRPLCESAALRAHFRKKKFDENKKNKRKQKKKKKENGKKNIIF
jgi:hypothetical protein